MIQNQDAGKIDKNEQMFSIREQIESREVAQLSEFAAKSLYTKGREKAEESCPIRTVFQRDRDRILHSKAFRRLKHKTQVFLSPGDDHYRTRLTHTLEVSQIARTIARALWLNEDLTEAIALGHDLGHTPFGHAGEDVLDELLEDGFRHNVQSVRIVTKLENLNLTQETIDGILHHTGKDFPFTLEGQIVKIADRIAYIHHDMDDSLRADVIQASDLPKKTMEYFGYENKKLLEKMIIDIIETSRNKPQIRMSEECFGYMQELRRWMFDNVYLNQLAKSQENKAKRLLKELFSYYMEVLEPVKVDANKNLIQRTVADYIAGMTDRYAIKKYTKNFVPEAMKMQNQDDYLFKLLRINGLEV